MPEIINHTRIKNQNFKDARTEAERLLEQERLRRQAEEDQKKDDAANKSKNHTNS